MDPLLSKSKFLSGLQCSRRLWLEVHRPELAPPPDPQTEALFATGREVGELARQCFPRGVLVEEAYHQHDQAVERSAEVLGQAGVPAIFEAAFSHDGVCMRADILGRGEAGWRLIEVKSSASLKDEHVPDLAVQHHVLSGCGVEVESDHLMRINTGYVYDGRRLDLGQLFTLDDATGAVAGMAGEVPDLLAEQRTLLASLDEPAVAPAFQCASPWNCPFTSHCTEDKPRYWVRRLPGIGRSRFEELVAAGIEDIADIPPSFGLTERQQRACMATRTGRPWVSADLGGELSAIVRPVRFLDFETIGPVIPRYPGTRPYQAIPFQWSLYTVTPSGSATHTSFLSDSDLDPRRELAESLLEALGDRGSIVAYNAGFETGIIQGLAEALPDRAARLLGLLDRVVDLLSILRRCYYHRDLLGSFSLKQVVPVLVPDCAYGDLAIQDGAVASLEYLRMLSAPDPEERDRIRASLLDYCQRDTWAMVRIWEELGKVAETGA